MSWVRIASAAAIVLLIITGPLAAQERSKKTKLKSTDRPSAKSRGGESYEGAKIKSIERGKIEFEAGGKTITLPVSLSMKVFDAEGKEHDPITGVRFLVPGNIVNIKTKLSAQGSTRETTIAEIHFVSGKVGEFPMTKEGVDLKPDPKYDGMVFESNLREKDWDAYYAKAKVGDFIQYRSSDEPGRREIVEVGSDYVVEAKVFYILGHRDEMRIKFRAFVERPLTGAPPTIRKTTSDEPKKTTKSQTSTKTAEKTPTKPSKSSSKTSKTEDKRTERAKAMAKSKEKAREPAAPREPETETITVAGRKLVCTIRKNSAGTKEWICPDVPFDGMVKNDSRLHYQLVDFGWGK
jgi:hypothetical protein